MHFLTHAWLTRIAKWASRPSSILLGILGLAVIGAIVVPIVSPEVHPKFYDVMEAVVYTAGSAFGIARVVEKVRK